MWSGFPSLIYRPYHSLACSPDWMVVRLGEAENMGLWELERPRICETFFLMTNEMVRGVSASSGKQTVLKGGSMVAVECGCPC